MHNMDNEIIIRGKRYLGRFSIEEKISERQVYIDGEYAARWETVRDPWFRGRGTIKDIETGKRERFQFFPKENSEKAIIPYLNEDEIKDKSKVDFALNLLYNQARDSYEIYPNVNLEAAVRLVD